MKTIKVRIPVTQLEVVFKDMNIECESDLAEIILDFERQLNNLKLVSDVAPIGMYPRFHLGGDYEILCASDTTLQGRTSLASYQQHELRVSARQRNDSGVQEDAEVQQGKSTCLSEEKGLSEIAAVVGHFEDGLINVKETFNKIADVVLRVTTKDQPGVTLAMSDKRLGEILKEKGFKI